MLGMALQLLRVKYSTPPLCRDRTVLQTASQDVSVFARLRRIATFLFIGSLEAYLLTYLFIWIRKQQNHIKASHAEQ